MPHDFFLSYANSDNAPAIPNLPASEWVTTFHDVLAKRVRFFLGRPVDTFFDRGDLSGNSALTPDIKAGLASSHLFVAISSPAYYQRPWCKLERDAFIQQLGRDPAAAKRVFVIHTTDVDRHIKPMTWQEQFFPDIRGYKFYRESTSGDGMNRTLGYPSLTDKESDYYNEIERLAHDMADRIKQIVDGGGAPVVPPGDSDAVFLAETALRSHNDRERLRTALQTAGYEVRPAGTLWNKPPNELAAAVANTLAFVQIISPALLELPGSGGKTYDEVQLEAAAALPKFRWRAPDLNLKEASANYPQFQSFAEAGDVRVSLLGQFEIDLLAQLDKLRAERRVKSAVHGSDPLVLVTGEASDLETHAATVTQQLQSRAVGHLVTDSPAEELEAPDVRGFLVLYGGSKAEWVRDRLRIVRTLPKSRARDLRVGIYFCPPPPEAAGRRLLFDMPSFSKIWWDKPASLDAFATAVSQ